jgi:hypothetical protein
LLYLNLGDMIICTCPSSLVAIPLDLFQSLSGSVRTTVSEFKM